MRMRVADYIAQFIEHYGVKDVFLLSGGGIMHLTDGLACNKKINVVCFHHEQAAAMALDAYSRVSGHFSVGYFTTGPGNRPASILFYWQPGPWRLWRRCISG